MIKNQNIRFGLSALVAVCASFSAVIAGTPTSGDLYFTRYQGGGGPRVAKVPFNYDGTTATLGAEVPIVQNTGADGIIFSPNGNLLIGGQSPVVHEYKTDGTFVATGNATRLPAAYHLALDPSGTKVWTSPFGGALADLPLSPNVGDSGAPHAITGQNLFNNDDDGVTGIAFAPNGKVFYVNGQPNGGGHVGEIDLTTFETDRFASSVESAHGIVYDSFTKLMTLFGAGKVGTFDPTSATPGATLKQTANDLTADFDQGAVDGKGHALIAGNNSITFIDYSATGDITSAANYVKVFDGFWFIDDVAPLSGLGSIDQGVPDNAGASVTLALLLPLLAHSIRRRTQRA